MKTLAVLLVTFGLFAHATNNAVCPHQNKGKLDDVTTGDSGSSSSGSSSGNILKAKAKK